MCNDKLDEDLGPRKIKVKNRSIEETSFEKTRHEELQGFMRDGTS